MNPVGIAGPAGIAGPVRKRRLAALGTALLLLGSFGALFWRVVLLDETFIDRDLHAFFRPGRALLVRLVAETDGLPLWNPYLAAGQPFAANPQFQLFHPASLLFFVLPFAWAWRLQVILPVVLGGASMHVLLGVLGRSAAARLFGAIAWAGSGYVLSTANLLPILWAIAAIPAALGFLIRVARGGGPRDVAGLAVATGLTALPGEIPSVYALGLLSLAALLEGLRGLAPHAAGRSLLRAAAGLALGALLAAAVLLPGSLHVKKTIREGGLDPAGAAAWSFPPARLVELVAPRALGHVERDSETWFWGGRLYPDLGYPFLFSVYLGLAVPLVSALGFIGKRRSGLAWAPSLGRSPSLAWAAVGTVGLLVAMGRHTPLFEAARQLVPFLSGFRIPERFFCVPALALCVAAAAGFDAVVLGRGREARRLGTISGILAGLGLLGAAFALTRGPEAWRRLGAAPIIAPELSRTLAADGLRLAAVAGALAALLLARDRLGRRGMAAGLLAVATLDVLGISRTVNRTVPESRATAVPPHLAQAKALGVTGPLVYLDTRGLPHQAWAAPPMPAMWGLSTALETDIDLTQLRWSFRAAELFRAAVARDPSLTAPLLQRLGAQALVTRRPPGAAAPAATAAAPSGPPVVIAFLSHPRSFAFAAERIERLARDEDWVDAVLRLGGEASGTACLLAGDAGNLPARPAPATVRVVARHPGAVELAVTGHGPGETFVAINQTWDAGWRASIDGHPARLLRTDVHLSGLAVPPGGHRVTLVYQDRSVALGLAISVAAALACLALALLRPRPKAAPPWP